MRVFIPDEVLQKLLRPVGESEGGFQNCSRRIQEGIGYDSAKRWFVDLRRDDPARVIEYSKPSYGSGTYQDNYFRPLAPFVVAELEKEQPRLFGDEDE
jgi:hypothetical protein